MSTLNIQPTRRSEKIFFYIPILDTRLSYISERKCVRVNALVNGVPAVVVLFNTMPEHAR